MTSDRGFNGEAELLSPVTPKSAGLNPNASVFSLSSKSPNSDVGWDALQSPTDSQNVNGYVSGSDVGYSPSSESPLPNNVDGAPMPMDQLVSSPEDMANGDIQTELGNEPVVSVEKLSEEQIRQMLKDQLEHCFSRENLAGDRYLQSQMDPDQYVPIATVAKLEPIQNLTSDLDLIIELLKEIPNLQISSTGDRVRPNFNRCIVILREIPEGTPVEEVKDLFADEACPRFVSCEFAHNDNWYVTFDSNESAQKAYQHLREKVQVFKGKPILARIKANSIIKMTYPQNGYKSKFREFQEQQAAAAAAAQQQQQAAAGAIAGQPMQVTSQASQQGLQPILPSPPSTVTMVSSPGGSDGLVTTVSQMQGGQAYSMQQMQTMMPQYSQLPFFAPNLVPNNWATGNTLMDPSLVLAINGYQATSVKVSTPPRHAYSNNTAANRRGGNLHPRINRDHRSHDGRQPSDRQLNERNLSRDHDRYRDNPRDRDKDLSGPGHRTSPRMLGSDNSASHYSSHHSPHYSHRGRGENSMANSHHSSGASHGGPGPSHTHQTGEGMSGGPLYRQSSNDSQRSKGYRNRRRRDDDGARNVPRHNNTPSAAPVKEGKPPTENQFDLEINSFPPLPVATTTQSSTSSEGFDSQMNKFSDVAKGAIKPAQNIHHHHQQHQTSSSSSHHQHPLPQSSQPSASSSSSVIPNTSVATSSSGTVTGGHTLASVVSQSVTSSPAVTQDVATTTTSVASSPQPEMATPTQAVPPTAVVSALTTEAAPVSTVVSAAVTESNATPAHAHRPNRPSQNAERGYHRQQQSTNQNTAQKPSSANTSGSKPPAVADKVNPADKVSNNTNAGGGGGGKLTYAQMLARGKEEEAAAAAAAAAMETRPQVNSSSSDEASEDTAANGQSAAANKTSQALRESSSSSNSQGSHAPPSHQSRANGAFGNNNRDNGHRREFEPKEQRFSNNRRSKENREFRDRRKSDRDSREGSRSSNK